MTTLQIPPLSTELVTPALRLRPWRPDDAESLHEAVLESVGTVGRWLPWCHEGYARDNAQAWIARSQAGWQQGDAYVFGIFDKTGELLGDIGLNRLDRQHRHANLGYWVRQGAHGRGVAPNAVRAVAKFAFDTLGLVRIEIVAAVGNQPSRRCAEKAGARLEGIGRHRIVVNDTPVDVAIYSLLPDDLAQPADAQSAATSS